MNERSIFLAALEIDDRAERDEYVVRACGSDTILRGQVENLLAAHAEPGGFMKRPAPAVVAELAERTVVEGPGTVIDAYKLLEQIGEGGFGVVYMAEQSHPVQRRVALKIIKPGMDSRQVIARFEAERQALALMDHPNIAHVFDGGQTDSGRPFFVMELVRGVPITQYCDENQLPLRDRLRLFVDVCQAVQHAHQKGVIHRDLKPSNVLVTLHDDKAVVKVIDFGIAKAMGQRLTEKTLFTNFTQMIGTPLYMSPEQAQMSGLDVDTRSDIYSLGVLHYELLTGTTPFDSQRLKSATFDEIRRIIAEEEPPKPSTRMNTPGNAAARTERQSDRGGAPGGGRSLPGAWSGRLFRGELDWIVMKCLEKDRNRRYATANGLAADVDRYLRDEPVQACPPSAWYRFRKLVRRNKAPFVAAAAVALVMLASIVILLVSNLRVRREQARTLTEMLRAEEAEKLALRRADEINQGMERLKATNELVDTARYFAFERRWDDASLAFTRAIEARTEHAPAWEGRGNLYASLGLWDLAADDLAHAAELQDPVNAHNWLQLALTRAYVGDIAGYRAACARMTERLQGSTVNRFTIDLVRACVLTPESPADPLVLARTAEAIVAVEPQVPWFRHALGAAHYRAGQYEKAIERLRESLNVDPNWNARAINYPYLAMAYHRLGRHDEARQALDEAQAALDRWTEARHEASGRGYWVVSQGATDFWPVFWWDWMVCQIACGEARREMGLGPLPDDPRRHVLRARALAGLRWTDKAAEEYAEALQARPDDKQILLELHRTRGQLYSWQSKWQPAAAEYVRASSLQPDEPYLWWYQAVLNLAAADRESYRRVCTDMLDRFGGTDDARTAHAVVAACTLLPDALSDMGRLVPVGQVAARWYPGSSRMLAAAQCRAGAYEQAVRSFREAAIHYRLRAGDLLLLALAHHHLGDAEEATGCLSKAIQWINEANRQQLSDPASTRPSWGDWPEPISVPFLRQEVESLLSD
jgi:serine/threonine protein kinase/Flp pilus assembly protein TadD